MRRLLLSILCLVMAFAIYGEDNGRKLNQNKENYLVKKGNVWFDFYSNISIYEGSEVLERKCCQLLGIDEQQSLQGFVDERLKTNDLKTSFSQDKLKQLLRGGFVGCDYIIVRPKGNPVGDCHTYEVIRIYQDKGMEKKSLQQWTIVYDQMNDKVLTVDDVFVPEVAIELKNKAGTDFINLLVKGTMVSYGATYTDDNINYKTIDYIRNADKFTEQFKQAIAFDERLAEADEEADKMVQQQKDRRENSQEEERGLKRIPYMRIKYDSGYMVVSEHFQPDMHDSGDETEQSSISRVRAGKYILEPNKNIDGTTDSIWVRHLIRQQYKTKREYYYTNSAYTTSSLNNRWTTIYDIAVPLDNPVFEQLLCKLLLDRNGKSLDVEKEKFSKYFRGKNIGGESANAIKIEGKALTCNPEKYYSYAYRCTYSIRKDERGSTSFEVVGAPFSGNIIYDIENQKLLSLSDVLTEEEIAHLGLKKKSKTDLALDKYYLYIGIDGKPVSRYALSRENWNKFTSVLQNLIAPYDSLPAKIDSTVLVCQDFIGVQPQSISYKINQEPLYGGHVDSLRVYLKFHLALPDNIKSRQSWKVQLVVGKDGRVSHVETKADNNSDVDESFASKLTETFEQMPAWQPLELAEFGVQESLLTYKIQFVPKANLDDIDNEMVEKNAQFPGGDEACLKWISENVHYPAICMEQGVQGRVIVEFIVDTDGSITEIEVLKSPDPALSEEAKRVVKLMPKWEPAKFGGEPIRSRYMLPIMFMLGSSNR